MSQPLLYNPTMSISQLLATMCADLADADLNAIRKGRGFSLRETASRDSFANFFISSIGVAEVMRQLTAEEAMTLHLLHQIGEVEIQFFERLYGSAGVPGRTYYGTFTQQFKPTLDAVKKNLVRKGVLIMAEVKRRGESVQMERWRFALPPEFAPFLPGVLQPVDIDQPGETSDRITRKKLLQLIGGGSAIANDPLQIQMINGSILLGDRPFTVKNMIAWQHSAWQAANKSSDGVSATPVDAICSLFGDLNPGQWATAKSLEPVLKILSFGSKAPLPAEKILHQGWDFGVLSRLKKEEDLFYRLAPALARPDLDHLPSPIAWLQVSPKRDSAQVDLRRIPLAQLELLNTLAHLSVENGALLTLPSLIQLGHSLPEQRQSALMRWLVENIPAFGEAQVKVTQHWGKTLLHENLLVAQVRDLSLRVQLERELGPKIVILSDHFIAFPADSRSSVEKVLKKTGFVIKAVKSSPDQKS
jgi:hypothetical protein